MLSIPTIPSFYLSLADFAKTAIGVPQETTGIITLLEYYFLLPYDFLISFELDFQLRRTHFL